VSYTPSYFTYNITVSVKDTSGNTYFGGNAVVPSGNTDTLIFYGHDATGNGGRGIATDINGFKPSVNFPLDAVFGPDYKLYVSGLNDGDIDVFFLNGTFEKTLSPTGRSCSGTTTRCSAAGMAFGPDGFLYVAYNDSDEVLRFNPLTGASSVFVTSLVYPGNTSTSATLAATRSTGSTGARGPTWACS